MCLLQRRCNLGPSIHAGVRESGIDELKRIIKQHPQKAIPQIESVEPENAPFRE